MKRIIKYLSAAVFGIGFLVISNSAECQVEYAGVNLAGAEFGDHTLPGNYNQHYTYPTKAEVDYFTGKGMNIFRLPFRWERLQHSAYANLNSTELSRIKSFVDYASSKGAAIILDPHNYARYYGKIIGSEDLPVEAFADFWEKLAMQFKNNPSVIFGLMNEPHSMATELWLKGANAAIAAIRSTGAENLILVPGNGWSGAHSWTQNWYGTPNGTVMLNIVDSLDNYAYEVHQYLDSNSSGTSETCVSVNTGADRLKTFTAWLRTHKKRGFLGEFGVAANETCMEALDKMLKYMNDNNDVWLGWTWWAAGPWWGEYKFTVEPKNGLDRPQMAILEKYANLTTGAKKLSDQSGQAVLFQNFPNPFSVSTEIEFYIPESSFVELNVFSMCGQKITCLVNERLTPGIHKVNWNTQNENGKFIARGFYFYILRHGNAGQVAKKMLLVK
jgi:endoglucanase